MRMREKQADEESRDYNRKAKTLMPDPTTNPAPSNSVVPAPTVKDGTISKPSTGPAPTQSEPTIHIADEFGTAKRNLPPAKPLLITMAVVLVVVAIVAFSSAQNRKAQDRSITWSQSIFLGRTRFWWRSHLPSATQAKNLYGLMTLKVSWSPRVATLSGDAVSAVDFDRYYQAFPALKQNALTALSPEDKLQPGEEVKRTMMVSFPVRSTRSTSGNR